MNHIMMVGAGSVGGYFGAHLAQHYPTVSFLLRPKTFAVKPIVLDQGLSLASQPARQPGRGQRHQETLHLIPKGHVMPGMPLGHGAKQCRETPLSDQIGEIVRKASVIPG